MKITIDLPAELDTVLISLARETGQSQQRVALRALLDRLEDYEDAKAAEEAIPADDGVRIPLGQLKRDLAEDDNPDAASKSAAE